MADEPRRSGRATKGQYTKDRDFDEDGPKKKSKAKGSKAKEPETQDEENEIIRCICGQYEEEEDTQRDMICCDKCSAWQHNDCMLLPYPPQEAPDKYYCEQCKPQDHKELLSAIGRGEKPWEEVARKREAIEAEKAAKKKKGGKRGRKSGSRPSEAASEADPEVHITQTTGNTQAPGNTQGPTNTPASANVQTPADTQTSAKEAGPSSAGQKRKHEEHIHSTSTPQESKKQRQTSIPSAPPSADAQNGAHHPTEKRKQSLVQTPSRQGSRSELIHEPVAASLGELGSQRKSIAASLVKLFSSEAAAAQKQGKFRVPAGQTTDGIGLQLGLTIEHALYHILCHGTGEPNDAYKSKVRTILFNVKKNDTLRDGLLNGSITAQNLARMSPEDMASREQQLRDARIKQEQEKQHVIIQEQGPRIRRTHKGEEYVDETQQVAAEPDVLHAPVRRREVESGEETGGLRSPTVASPDGGQRSPVAQPLSINTQTRPRPSIEPERKSSQPFNIQDVWSSVQGSPDGERLSFPHIPYQGSGPPQKANQTEADPDIDALLKDEDVESPPYSPKSYEGDQAVVWRGSVNMSPVARFQGTASKAAGADVEDLGLTWSRLIPEILTIEGRIDPARADSYLCGLRYSSTSNVIVVSLRASDTPTDRHQFSVLFNYFKTRNRYGVGVNPANPAIKDIYLIPLEAGSDRKPELLQLLDNDKTTTPIPEDMLLVPFVIKTSELNATPRDTHPIAASPIAGVPPGLGHPPVPNSMQTSFSASTPSPSDQHRPPPQSQLPTSHNSPPQPHQQLPPTHQQFSAPNYTISHSVSAPAPFLAGGPESGPGPGPTGHEAAHLILGPAAAQFPAVQQLLRQAPDAGIPEMNVVKDCLNQNLGAGQDLGVLTTMLLERQQVGSDGPAPGQGG